MVTNREAMESAISRAKAAESDRDIFAEALAEADDYIERLNALCKEFGCPPKVDRLRWLRKQLSRAASR